MESHQMHGLPIYLFVVAGLCFLLPTLVDIPALTPFLYGVAAVLIVISEVCFLYTYLKKRKAEKKEQKKK